MMNMERGLSKLVLKFLLLSITFLHFAKNVVAQENYESRALVVPSQEAIISSEIAARIDSVGVKEMDRFQKGDLLIQFDCSLYEAQKDVVSANANSALIKLKSGEQMLQMRSIGKYELELSKSEFEKAKAELTELNAENDKLRKQALADRDALLKEAAATKAKILADAKNQAKSESEKILTNAREVIKNEKMAAITELKNQVALLSLDIAEKIVKEQLTSSDKQKALVDNLIKEVNLN